MNHESDKVAAVEKEIRDFIPKKSLPITTRSRSGPSMRDDLRAGLTQLRETIVAMDKSIVELERTLEHHLDGHS